MQQKQQKEKSIDDYRHLIKLLKLKILKQEDHLFKLKERSVAAPPQTHISKKPPNQLVAKIVQTRSLKKISANVQLLRLYNQFGQKIGFSLEKIFLIADKQYNKLCSSRQFLNCLKSLLKLPMAVAILKIFDEQCLGIIHYQDFRKIMQIYGVRQNINKSWQQQLQRIVRDHDIQIQTVLDRDLDRFAQNLKQATHNRFLTKDILALHQFIYQDGNLSKLKLDMIRYQDHLKSNMTPLKKRSSMLLPVIQSASKESEDNRRQSNDFFKSQKKIQITAFKRIFKQIQIRFQDKRQIKKQQAEEIISLLQEKGLQVSQLVLMLCNQKVQLLKQPITLVKFYRLVSGLYPSFVKKEIHLLFNVIDYNQVGSFTFSDLLLFYINRKSQRQDMLICIRILAIIIYENGESPNSLMNTHKFQNENKLLWKDFVSIFDQFIDFDLSALRKLFQYMCRFSISGFQDMKGVQSQWMRVQQFMNLIKLNFYQFTDLKLGVSNILEIMTQKHDFFYNQPNIYDEITKACRDKKIQSELFEDQSHLQTVEQPSPQDSMGHIQSKPSDSDGLGLDIKQSQPMVDEQKDPIQKKKIDQEKGEEGGQQGDFTLQEFE